MIIKVHLRVKFRAFFITFGNVDKVFDVKVATNGTTSGYEVGKVLYNDRGILLELL